MIWWAILLFLAGMALILAEFLVPGGICGGVGALLVLASGAIACLQYPDRVLLIVCTEVVGVVICMIAGMYMLSRTRAGKFIVLEETQQQNEGWVAWDSDMSLIGAEGEVFTQLRPAGTIIVDGKRIGAVSDGSFIEKGAKVRVTEVHGNRVVVEETVT